MAYTCWKCDIPFKRESSLHRHDEVMHGNGKNVKCTHCTLEFKSRHEVRLHISVGDGCPLAPKHECEVCNKEFTSRPKLAKHVSQVHIKKKEEGDEEKRYLCKKKGCVKTFASSSNAARHYRTIHMKRVAVYCDKCFKTFTTKYRAKMHQAQCDIQVQLETTTVNHAAILAF